MSEQTSIGEVSNGLIAQYDLHVRLTGPGYRLDVQTDYLDDLKTRIGIPILPRDEALEIAQDLNPIFRVDGNGLVLVTQRVSAVPIAETAEQRGNFSTDRDQVARSRPPAP